MKEVMDPTTITRNEDTGGTQEREEGGWQGGGSGRPRSSRRKGEQRREHEADDSGSTRNIFLAALFHLIPNQINVKWNGATHFHLTPKLNATLL
jgi:hypothetical protein